MLKNRFIPRIENMEERVVPATFTWTGGAPNDGMHLAANWNLAAGNDADGIPDADDDIVVTNVAQGVPDVVAGNPITVNGLQINAGAVVIDLNDDLTVGGADGSQLENVEFRMNDDVTVQFNLSLLLVEDTKFYHINNDHEEASVVLAGAVTQSDGLEMGVDFHVNGGALILIGQGYLKLRNNASMILSGATLELSKDNIDDGVFDFGGGVSIVGQSPESRIYARNDSEIVRSAAQGDFDAHYVYIDVPIELEGSRLSVRSYAHLIVRVEHEYAIYVDSTSELRLDEGVQLIMSDANNNGVLIDGLMTVNENPALQSDEVYLSGDITLDSATLVLGDHVLQRYMGLYTNDGHMYIYGATNLAIKVDGDNSEIFDVITVEDGNIVFDQAFNFSHLQVAVIGQLGNTDLTWPVFKSGSANDAANTMEIIGDDGDDNDQWYQLFGNGGIDVVFDKIPNAGANAGGNAFNDIDRDGILDAEEGALSNVSVDLYDDQNIWISSTTTDESGNYLFEDLQDGTYHATFSYNATMGEPVEATTSFAADLSNGDKFYVWVESQDFVISGSDVTLTEFGVWTDPLSASVTGDVWEDADQDAVWDSGETLLQGVNIELWDVDYGVVGTFWSNDGTYNFDNLWHGTYYLTFDFLPPMGEETSFTTPITDISGGDPYWAYGQISNFVLDAEEQEDIDDVGIWIEDTNASPDAIDDTANTTQDIPVNIFVLDNDSDPDPADILSIDSVGAAMNGTASHDGYSVTYTPDAGFFGNDSFTYTITDGNGGYDTANVSITVDEESGSGGSGGSGGGNNAPFANDDFEYTSEGIQLSGNVLTNDFDPDGDPLTATLDTGPSNGVVGLNSDGSYIYTPNTGFSGSDSFTYYASDGVDSSVATVWITVDPDDPPVQEATVGDFVWLDSNFNGIQDAGEGALAGVLVELLDDTGIVIDSYVTDSTGYYEFLVSSDTIYQLRFTSDASYAPTSQYSGSDSALDSDVDIDGLTAFFSLYAGEFRDDFDAGFVYTL